MAAVVVLVYYESKEGVATSEEHGDKKVYRHAEDVVSGSLSHETAQMMVLHTPSREYLRKPWLLKVTNSFYKFSYLEFHPCAIVKHLDFAIIKLRYSIKIPSSIIICFYKNI